MALLAIHANHQLQGNIEDSILFFNIFRYIYFCELWGYLYFFATTNSYLSNHNVFEIRILTCTLGWIYVADSTRITEPENRELAPYLTTYTPTELGEEVV